MIRSSNVEQEKLGILKKKREMFLEWLVAIKMRKRILLMCNKKMNAFKDMSKNSLSLIQMFGEDLGCPFWECPLNVWFEKHVLEKFPNSIQKLSCKEDIDNLMQKKFTICQFQKDYIQIDETTKKMKRVFAFIHMKLKYQLGLEEDEIIKFIKTYEAKTTQKS